MRRELILKIIKENPGIGYNELVRHANLSNGVISHYIIQLMNDKMIEKYGDVRSKYFLTNVKEKDRKIVVILRNQTCNNICKCLIENSKNKLEPKNRKGLTAEEVSKITGKSRSTISVNLKNLQRNGIVERVILNRKSKLTNDIGYFVPEIKFWVKFLVKYRL